MKSILQQTRSEGWKTGYREGRQLAWMTEEECYENGKRDAWAEAPSRFKWFACGAVVASMIGYFL